MAAEHIFKWSFYTYIYYINAGLVSETKLHMHMQMYLFLFWQGDPLNKTHRQHLYALTCGTDTACLQ